MPWVGSAGGGFSGDAAVKPWLPLKANHLALNAAGQVADAHSMLNFLKARLAVRKANPSLLYGDCVLLETTNPQLVAFTRSYQGQATLCAFNFDVANSAKINGHVLQPLGWLVV
jgi:alpha-glucosidase